MGSERHGRARVITLLWGREEGYYLVGFDGPGCEGGGHYLVGFDGPGQLG